MKISIVSGLYNHEKTLPLLYESVKSQVNDVHELILCDDGSDDNTQDLMDQYQKEGIIPIKTFKQAHRGMRLAKSLNRGFRAATGDVIFVVMGDSYLFSDTLKQIKANYSIATAGSAMRVNVDSNGNFVSYDWRVGSTQGLNINVTGYKNYYQYLTGNGMIAPKNMLKQIGYWDERFEGYGKDDWFCFVKLFKAGLQLYQYNTIKIYHVDHPSTTDNPENTKLFNELIK